MLTSDIRGFLDLMTDDWLIAMRDKLAEAILANNRTTSFSYVGKSGTSNYEIATADLAQQLSDVFRARGIGGVAPQTRMTAARFI
jgi:hypothetical protein